MLSPSDDDSIRSHPSAESAGKKKTAAVLEVQGEKGEGKKAQEEVSAEPSDRGAAFGVKLRSLSHANYRAPPSPLGPFSPTLQSPGHPSPSLRSPRTHANSDASPFAVGMSRSSSSGSTSSSRSTHTERIVGTSSPRPTPPPIPTRPPFQSRRAADPQHIITRLFPAQRRRYMEAFRSLHPTFPDTPMPSYVVRQVWEKSHLPKGDLSRIWTCASGGSNGKVDKQAWCVGMWLIDECLAGRRASLSGL